MRDKAVSIIGELVLKAMDITGEKFIKLGTARAHLDHEDQLTWDIAINALKYDNGKC